MSKKRNTTQRESHKAATKKASKKGKAGQVTAPVAAEVTPAATEAPATQKQARKAKTPKAKRVSALDAAATVLRAEGGPMNCKALIATMAAQELWTSPGGKTPEATLYAAMQREERNKGSASRFRKVDRGQFAFNG